MGAAPVERPVASAAYFFVRFTGRAIGPWVALKLAEDVDLSAPFWFGAAAVAIGVVVVAAGSRTISGALASGPAQHGVTEAHAHAASGESS